MSLYTSINSPVPGSRSYPLYINGLTTSVYDNTTLLLSVGACDDSLNITDISIGTEVYLDATINGVNGLDTGSIAASTFYYIYVIGSSNGLYESGGLISTSASSPVMPTGYDIFRLVDIKLTDGSSHFVSSYTDGYYGDRVMYYDTPIAVLTTSGSATFAAITNLADAVPPLALSNVNFIASLTPNTAANILYLRPTGSSSTGFAEMNAPVISVLSVGDLSCISLLSSSVSSIDYKTTEATDRASLAVKSFSFEV